MSVTASELSTPYCSTYIPEPTEQVERETAFVDKIVGSELRAWGDERDLSQVETAVVDVLILAQVPEGSTKEKLSNHLRNEEALLAKSEYPTVRSIVPVIDVFVRALGSKFYRESVGGDSGVGGVDSGD